MYIVFFVSASIFALQALQKENVWKNDFELLILQKTMILKML